VATRIGIHPVHFDIVQTAAVGIGLFTPPMGVGRYGAPLRPGAGAATCAELLALPDRTLHRSDADHLHPRVSLFLPRSAGLIK
jgi:hypothetical protein